MSARAAWREVCMAEYRITGDMWKAIKFADSVAQRFRAETLREAAETINNEDLPQDIGNVADICEGARWATAQLIRMAEEEK